MQNYNEKNIRELQEKHKRKAKFENIHHSGSKIPLDNNTFNDTDSIYYQLFEHNNNAVLLSCPDGTVHAANSAACKLFRRTEDDIKKIGLYGLVDLTDPRLQVTIKEQEQTGKFNGELTFIRKDGAKFQGQLTSLVFNDKDGNIRTCMTIQDISEQKNAEQIVFEQRNFYDLILKNVHDGIWVTNEKDRLIYLNSEMEKIAGAKSENVLGLSVIKDFPRETTSQFLRFYLKAKKTLEPQEYEAEVVTPAGRKTIQSGWLTPRVNNGKYEGIICTIQDITERKKAEQALIKKDILLQETQKLGKLGGWECDIAQNKATWTDEVYKIYGVEKDFDISDLEKGLAFYHEQDRENLRQAFERCFNEHKPYDMEVRFINAKGEHLWCRTIGTPVIENGKLIKLRGNLIDITERKKAEFRLKESEEKYRLLVETLNEGIWKIDDKGYTTFVNSKMAEMLDYSVDEMLGKHLFSFMDEKGMKIAREKMNERKNGIKSQHEFIFQKKNGEQIQTLLNTSPIFDSQGNYAGAMAGISDITEYTQAMEEIRTSEIRYRELFEHMPSGVAVYDVIDGGKDFIFKDFNHSGELFTKQPNENLTGKSIFKVFPGVEDFGLIDAFRKAIKSGQPVHHSDRLYKDNRFSAWYDNYIYLLPSGELVTIFSDVTQLKKAEEALRESEEMFRSLFELAPNSMLLLSVDGKFIKVNKSLCEMLGYSESELLSKTFRDITYSEDLASSIEWVHKLLTDETTEIDLEKRYIHKSGHLLWGIVRALLKRDSNGMPLYFITHIQDITERKHMEDALKENERLLNEVGTIAKIGGWEMDLIARKAKWTKGTYDIVEIDYDKPIPGPDEHLDYYLSEYKHIVEKAINELIEKDTPLMFEAKAKTAMGNVKWFKAAAKAIRENDVCTKIVGTLQDITEIKQSEEILNNHRRLLEKQMYLSKTLLDAIPCVALLLKPETHEIVASNKAAIKVGAIPGKTCYETWAQRANTCPWCMAPKLWKTAKEQHIEVEYMDIFWDAYWIPVSDDLYMHFAFDITERKKIEAKIFKYQQQLKSLASQLTLTEEKERYRIATHLHDHIGQYLAVSRIKLVELLNSDIPEGTYNTVKLIDEWLHHAIKETRSLTYDLSSPILHELGIKKAIESWLDDEIRRKYQIETEFYCDNTQIPLEDDIQVLLFRDVRELLFNVVKHAHADKITVAIQTKDNNIQIIVEDNGVGFNPAEISETAPGKAQFGLFSIRERLEQFGGNINIETAAGQGCRITLTAPIKKDYIYPIYKSENIKD